MPERTLRHSFKAAEFRSAVIISALLAAGTLAAAPVPLTDRFMLLGVL